MKWDYHVRVEVDTNDGDYIRNDYHFGTYDDENEQDVKSLAVKVLVYNHFEVEDGENNFRICSFLKELKTLELKPSDRNEDWKKYDCLLSYDPYSFDEDELDDYEDYEDDDEDENTKTLPKKDEDEDDGEVPEHILALAADLKHEVEDEIGDCLPWMDNCDYNHSFSYDLTRRPAGVKEEICSVNYDAKSYKDVLKFGAMYANEDDDDDDDFDFEGEDD